MGMTECGKHGKPLSRFPSLSTLFGNPFGITTLPQPRRRELFLEVVTTVDELAPEEFDDSFGDGSGPGQSIMAAHKLMVVDLSFITINGLFVTFGEDDRKITEKAQTTVPAARAVCLRPYKTSEISNRLADLRANEQYHQM